MTLSGPSTMCSACRGLREHFDQPAFTDFIQMHQIILINSVDSDLSEWKVGHGVAVCPVVPAHQITMLLGGTWWPHTSMLRSPGVDRAVPVASGGNILRVAAGRRQKDTHHTDSQLHLL